MARYNESTSLWDDLDAANQADIDAAYDFGGSWGKESGYTFRRKPAGPPTPPKDGKGNELTAVQIAEALDNLRETRLRLDEVVSDIEDAEAQAKQAKKLGEKWAKKQKKLEDQLDQAERYERHVLAEKGIKDFGMPDDEGNREITKLVKDECEWFDEKVDALKDELANRIRERLTEMGGDANRVAVRDNIYDSLIENEVIESWEPLEF